MRHDIHIEGQRVIVRTEDATTTVYLSPTSESLVTVNRDDGSPTERISRQSPNYEPSEADLRARVQR